MNDYKEPLIYLISGKARAGKDTTSTFIKEYYSSKNKLVKELELKKPIEEIAKFISSWDGNDKTKPRTIMQSVGTKIRSIDEMYFINDVKAKINIYKYFADVIIIPDIRMELEIIELKKAFKNVVLINLTRKNHQDGMNEPQRKHLTETSLDNFHNYDYIINNNETLKELKEKIIKIINKGE